MELPELKLLIDAVEAARFIPQPKSEALIEKLETELEELQTELQKDENLSDYVKLTELQEQIDEKEMQLLEAMESLEEMQN